MKLLLVSHVPNSRLMGVPRVLHCVADVLRQRGHQVDLFFEEDGPALVWKRLPHLEWSLRVLPRLIRQCRQAAQCQQPYDALIITTMSGWCLSAFCRKLLPPSLKILSWHHGLETLMWEQMREEEKTGGFQFSTRFKLYYGGFIRWALMKSLYTQDGAFFTSTEERDWAQAQTKKNHLYYLPNGVEDTYAYPARFERMPRENAALRLLFVGYWDPWRKGKKYLTKAFTQLHAQYPELYLSLVGTKYSADEILPEFSPACRESITVIPEADEPTLIEMYRQHDVLLLPSLFEGMPLVMLEAMAAGMAVITTHNNGMRDVIQSGENGLLIPRRDIDALVEAVRQLVDSPELRHRLGQAAYETIRAQHRWIHVASQLEQYLQEVLAS